jgi:hypothetical protein
MRISEAKECIKELYLNTRSVTALISERGIGKTSAYSQCAQELGIGYINLYAAALEGPDLWAYPIRIGSIRLRYILLRSFCRQLRRWRWIISGKRDFSTGRD